MASAGWYPDPLGRAQVRYFDGTEWSQWAADDGKSRLDAEAVLTALPGPPDAPPPGMPPPPGTGWSPSQQGGASVARFRSISGLSTALMWVLIGVAVSAVGAALALGYRLDAIDRLRGGSFAALQDVRDGDDAVDAMSTILSVFNVAVFVLFIIFLFRAVKNTELWNTVKEKWTPGWAIGSWFIPLANFVLPFLVVLETWRRSDSDVVTGAKPQTSTGLLWAWWLLFVVGYVAIQFDPYDNPTLDQIRVRDGVAIGGTLLLTASAILMIVLVRRLARWQHQNAQRGV
jgi:hypothetical protein